MSKKTSKEQRAWTTFNAMAFNSIFVSMGIGMLLILLVNHMPYTMLLMLICPVSYFVLWKIYAKEFLKEGIKP